MFTRFIYNAVCIISQGCLWGPGPVFILVSLINHFPGRISGASGEGGEGGGGVPAAPPLWPLTAPSNERRHSHTDVLTPCWSPFFPFLLPSSLSTVLSSCRQSTEAVHQGMSLSPPSLQLLFCFLYPSCFICLVIPHLHSPTPPSLLLSFSHSLPSLI